MLTDRDIMLRALYMEKGECVGAFPEWLLPPGKIEEYRSIPRLAIVEMAGRDSVAAAVKAVQDRGFTDLIPTYAYTGTEYGPWENIERAVERLSKRLPGTRIHELLLVGSPRFWQALNGRFAGALESRYGCSLTCVGCHMYLHGVRIPLSKLLGNVPLVAGERESHDGVVKINQVAMALESYRALVRAFDTELVLPLRHIHDGDCITGLLGFDWKEGREQLGCVLSGNYRGVTGDVHFENHRVCQYLDEFAAPAAEKIVRVYLEGRVPDHIQIAGERIGP